VTGIQRFVLPSDNPDAGCLELLFSVAWFHWFCRLV
jgi:hypothetical protein